MSLPAEPLGVAVLGGSNGGPPIIDPADAFAKIDDLYEEAKNFADGEPITTPEMAEAITALFDGLHEAGKEAEALRVAEKAPLDTRIDAIQSKYNPYVQPKKGKVAMGKDALGVLLTAWRVEQQRIAAAAADKARREAQALQAEATAAMQASAGNLAERERAEEIIGFAKEAERFAARSEKAATTGTGLRTKWVARLEDEEAALGWAYERSPELFTALCQQIADEAARSGVRTIPGFAVVEEKKAA
ncbi:hypothetical protein N8A98_06720 [Devosia neptuniae]|uniref:Phage protein n=1 Tax=Devosia neptuniae TaxID=191302 RepID=A0ABY6CF93_9HYPH|nr:hypothetical protein [Devosia neptuniae]UXN70874.1 hypothetical protein N8A98_06720 [Devosia neptuniae]